MFLEEFCVVPANSGQVKLSLEDKVWFSMHVCITIGSCGVGWIFGFVMQNIYSVLNHHSRNVMRVSRSACLVVFSCLRISDTVTVFVSVILSSSPNGLQDPE